MTDSKWNGVRCLVTGGAGFIGSALARRLVAEGATVTVLDDLSYGKYENVPTRARFIEDSVSTSSLLHDVVASSDVVFHLAAIATTKESQLGWLDPHLDFQVNALGTLRVLEAIKASPNPCRLVFASTAAVYGTIEYSPIDELHPTNPVSPYGVSKLASEKYCHAFAKEFGLDITIARIFNCFGPAQPRYVIHDFIKQLREDPKKLKVLGTGEQIRDFCYVDDVVAAFLGLAEYPGKIVNIAGSEGTRIKDLAKMVVDRISPGAQLEFTGKSWPGDIPVLVGDGRKLKHLTGVEVLPVEAGLDKMIDHLDAQMVAVHKISDRARS